MGPPWGQPAFWSSQQLAYMGMAYSFLPAAVKRSIDLIGGIDRFAKSGQRVLLKPNILMPSSPEKCVVTHPDVVYAVANLALPFFYLKHYREQFSVVRDLILPLIGTAVIVYPLYNLVKPGQMWPYNWFPYVALAMIVVAGIYAVILNSRDKDLATKVGALVADE